MASSSHPGAPFEDPDRVKLINQIDKGLATLEESATTIQRLRNCYGCLWLADMERPEYLVAKYLPNDPRQLLAMLYLRETEGKIVARWQQKDQNGESVDSRKNPGQSLDSPRRRRPRSQSAEDACRDRDEACILTKCGKDICQPCPLCSTHPGTPSEGAASSKPPGALFEEPERVKLIEMIAEKLGETVHTHRISTFKTSYAGLWLADIEKLKALGDKEPLDLYSRLSVSELEYKIDQRWQQKDNDAESRAPSAPQTPIKGTPPLFPSSSAPGPSAGEDSTASTPRPRDQPLSIDTPGSSGKSRKRPGEALGTPEGAKKPRIDKDVAEACKDRDKACILTRCSKDICQPCPLFPYWLNYENMDAVLQFFTALRGFWSDGKVDEWYNAIYGDGLGPEKPENLILLSPNAYVLYANGYIVFEPVDRDPEGKWLTLKFWWLKRHEHDEGVDFGVIPELPSDLHPSDYGVALHDVRNDRPLLSGEMIMLKTHDPENYPLPDTRILDMQWVLNRVSALSGTTEPKVPDDDDDEWDEDWDEGLG
ncbi:hypothetical protein Aspvir_003286 [Aspergillus viridinutans]|uniref:HNH nuclease domain-containing protein n=1 Tax=Aspergillus viridinutans TaxID=75553 RepID=A0A9P3C4E0_ASPVI|nr:uncharacterized protein Aspvir_003286 [Aspergillus viridinutans]GIK07620.1 hypothetical protein Aspvir_003286 [Aspergillus viridinutans]